MIPKKDLVHNTIYKGHCRNAVEARWDADKQRFVYWRNKFGVRFEEDIYHPEDEDFYDVFTPEEVKYEAI